MSTNIIVSSTNTAKFTRKPSQKMFTNTRKTKINKGINDYTAISNRFVFDKLHSCDALQRGRKKNLPIASMTYLALLWRLPASVLFSMFRFSQFIAAFHRRLEWIVIYQKIQYHAFSLPRLSPLTFCVCTDFYVTIGNVDEHPAQPRTRDNRTIHVVRVSNARDELPVQL